MKKFLLLLVVFSLCVFGYPVLTDFNIDWCYETGGFNGSPSFGTYNYATNHFLICDYTIQLVRIASGTDGSLTSNTLSTTGLNFTGGTLGIFSVCATSDGVIYGGIDGKTDGTAGVSLARWANESATPTQQDPAETAGTMIYPRAMDAIGTGVNTIVASTGDETYTASIMTTTNGTTFTVTDIIVGDATYDFKQGVALAEGMEKIYGCKADGTGNVIRFDKSGGVWSQSATFTPPNSYDLPPAGLGAAAVIGYAKGHNAVFVIGYLDAANDYMTLLDGDTGAIIVQKQIGKNVGTYGYGCIDLKETSGVGYFACRSGAGSAIMGKISFAVYVPPTPTPTPTPTPIPPTPTPTPTPPPTPIPTPEKIKHYLLGLDSNPTGLDLNGDGKVDIADLVWYLLGKQLAK
ncbi:MAG: hypothetical protein NT106_04150 [Candidatus Sumerlaeota bacterium]|nr:hypothetical protein [Candidatus Sumerlaeota bacterium]